ncbi:hypothetical protein, partial [Achromobacter marplatensis]|uniref:hypothetical protein n=1 Tax=Achromobacter marplatensis TaxID=470868 RepID=UPI0039EFA1E8
GTDRVGADKESTETWGTEMAVETEVHSRVPRFSGASVARVLRSGVRAVYNPLITVNALRHASMRLQGPTWV